MLALKRLTKRAALALVATAALLVTTTFASTSALAKPPPRRVAVLWLQSDDVDAKTKSAVATAVRNAMRWQIQDDKRLQGQIGVGKRESVGRFLKGPDRCSPAAADCARLAARALRATHFVTGTIAKEGRAYALELIAESTAPSTETKPLRVSGRAPTLQLLREEAVLVARRALKALSQTPVVAADPVVPTLEPELDLPPPPKDETLPHPKRSRVLHYDKPQTSGDIFVDGDYLAFVSAKESPIHENIRVPLWRIKAVHDAVMIGSVGITVVDDGSMFAEIYYFASAGERDDFKVKLLRLIDASKQKRAAERR